jgi:TonB-linked SusC/RagA family outer membrane protein
VGSFDDYNGPIEGGSGIYSRIMRANPVMFPAYYPSEVMPGANHILFGNFQGASSKMNLNPYSDMVKGYKDYSKSLMSAQFEVRQSLAMLTKGLSARGLFNTSRYSFFDVSRFYNPYFYTAGGYDKMEDTYTLALLNEGAATEYLGYKEGTRDINTTLYFETAVDYIKTIAKKHDLTGLLVYTRRQQLFSGQGTLQKSLPYRNQGVSGRFTYGYDSRYLAEVSFGYNGSERFSKNKRYGFFPAAGIGWFVSNEKFWEPLKNVISKLKFRATYGLAGNDAIGAADDRFFYLSEVNLNDGSKDASFGDNYLYTRPGVTVNRYANRDISWETSRKLNLGIDLGLFNDFQIQADYFTDNRSNILMTRASIPTSEGLSSAVRANVGEARSEGIDFSVDYNKSFNNSLWLSGRGNFTYAHNEYVAYEEPVYKEAYKSHIGQSLNQMYGLLAERLFIDEEDVQNSPRQNFGEYSAGDIKYRDVNRDGQITNLDMVPIGLPTSPEIVYGFGFSLGFKKLDFSAFFQGVARESFMIDASATAPFLEYYSTAERNGNASILSYGVQNQLLKAYADDYWSEDNRNSYALWPRLSKTGNSNNAQTSTWFLRNGAFLRLKQVELGYSLPKNLVDKISAKSFRLYVNATNLFLLSSFKLWDVEMGNNGLGYPIQKVFNIGAHINL